MKKKAPAKRSPKPSVKAATPDAKASRAEVREAIKRVDLTQDVLVRLLAECLETLDKCEKHLRGMSQRKAGK